MYSEICAVCISYTNLGICIALRNLTSFGGKSVSFEPLTAQKLNNRALSLGKKQEKKSHGATCLKRASGSYG